VFTLTISWRLIFFCNIILKNEVKRSERKYEKRNKDLPAKSFSAFIFNASTPTKNETIKKIVYLYNNLPDKGYNRKDFS
jgi:hypothetical protein